LTQRSIRLATLTVLILSTPLAAQSQSVHALDPLSGAEIRQAVATLRQSGHLSPQARFGTITVQPRGKVGPQPRAARVVGFDWTRNEAFVAVVDLTGARLESWTVVDSEPPMRLLTIRRAEEIAHADPRWVAAITSRGIDTARVGVLVSLPERAKLPRQGADRVVGAFVWLRDAIPNALTVGGILMQVNLTQGRLDGFIDSYAPMGNADSAATRGLASRVPRSLHSAHGTARPVGTRGGKRDHVGSLAPARRRRPSARARDSRCVVHRRRPMALDPVQRIRERDRRAVWRSNILDVVSA
jgi:hypothetical protein